MTEETEDLAVADFVRRMGRLDRYVMAFKRSMPSAEDLGDNWQTFLEELDASIEELHDSVDQVRSLILLIDREAPNPM